MVVTPHGNFFEKKITILKKNHNFKKKSQFFKKPYFSGERDPIGSPLAVRINTKILKNSLKYGLLPAKAETILTGKLPCNANIRGLPVRIHTKCKNGR